MRKKLIILKLGGSVITYKKENLKKINSTNLDRISSEIAYAIKQKKFSLVIIHGVGPFGHIIAKEFNLADGYKNYRQIRAISKLRDDLSMLNYEAVKSLIDKDINAVSFQPSAGWYFNNDEIIANNLKIIENLTDIKIVPVLYGDILTDSEKGFGILSGDKIAYCLAKNLKAEKVIIGTDIDGVFDKDPRINKNANLLKELSKKTAKNLQIGKSTAIDVTGGMKGKIEELLKLADIGIESEIINITKAGILKKALLGKENLGTRIMKQ